MPTRQKMKYTSSIVGTMMLFLGVLLVMLFSQSIAYSNDDDTADMADAETSTVAVSEAGNEDEKTTDVDSDSDPALDNEDGNDNTSVSETSGKESVSKTENSHETETVEDDLTEDESANESDESEEASTSEEEEEERPFKLEADFTYDESIEAIATVESENGYDSGSILSVEALSSKKTQKIIKTLEVDDGYKLVPVLAADVSVLDENDKETVIEQDNDFSLILADDGKDHEYVLYGQSPDGEWEELPSETGYIEEEDLIVVSSVTELPVSVVLVEKQEIISELAWPDKTASIDEEDSEYGYSLLLSDKSGFPAGSKLVFEVPSDSKIDKLSEKLEEQLLEAGQIVEDVPFALSVKAIDADGEDLKLSKGTSLSIALPVPSTRLENLSLYGNTADGKWDESEFEESEDGETGCALVKLSVDELGTFLFVQIAEATDEIEEKASQSKTETITARGKTYEIKVSYDETAELPDDAELKVEKLSADDEAYGSFQKDVAENLEDEDKFIPEQPLLLDISIQSNGKKVEPAENSQVKVEMRIVKDELGGLFTSPASPLLVNDYPLSGRTDEVESKVQLLHQVSEGEIEVVETEDTVSDDDVVSEFTTSSFSNWLVYLDEDATTIELAVGDTLTLRDFTEWRWHNSEEPAEYKNVDWKMKNSGGSYVDPFTTTAMKFEKFTRAENEDEIHEAYTLFHGTAQEAGSVVLYRVNSNGETVGNPITVNVVQKEPSAKPDVITENIANIKVNLFDYNTDAQDSSSTNNLDVKYNTASSWDKHGNYYTGGAQGSTSNFYQDDPPYEFSINTGSDLKFLGWGANNSTTTKYAINSYTANVPHQDIVQDELVGGYPALTSANSSTSLGYLFDTESQSESCYAYPNVSGLFQIDPETGYYFFNSNANYAEFDSEHNNMTLYEHTYTQVTQKNGTDQPSSKPIGFFPFHEYDSNNHLSPNHDTALNHHFGMSMEVKYSFSDGKLAADGSDVIYEFTGDDDLWVYVDDKLVLDIGGIHQPIRGYINFTTGKVYIYGTNDNKEVEVDWIKNLSIGEEHTLNMFYLERGGCDSNLSVRFNMPLTIAKADVSFAKERATDDNHASGERLDNVQFGLWENDELTGNPSRIVTSNSNGLITIEDLPIRDDGHVYYLREIRPHDGYLESDTVYTLTPVQDPQTGDYSFELGDMDDPSAIFEQTDDTPPLPIILNDVAKPVALTVEKDWIGGVPHGASATVKLMRYKSYDGYVTTTHEEDTDETDYTLYVYRRDPVHGHGDRLVGQYDYKRGTSATISWAYQEYYATHDNKQQYFTYCIDDGELQTGSYPGTNTISVDIPTARGSIVSVYLTDEWIDWHDNPQNNNPEYGVINVQVSGTGGAKVPVDVEETVHVSAHNEEDDDWPGIEKRLDSNTGWSYTFPEQIAYSQRPDGVYEYYTYYVKELNSTPAGFHVAYDSMNGNKIAGSNESTIRTVYNYPDKVYVQKRWYGPDGELLDPQPTTPVDVTLTSEHSNKIQTSPVKQQVVAGTPTEWAVANDGEEVYNATEDAITGYDTDYTFLDPGESVERDSGGVHRGGTIYVNNRAPFGALELSKKVSGQTVNMGRKFSFDISFASQSGDFINGTFRAQHSGNPDLTSVQIVNGQLSDIELKAGETFKVYGLPKNTGYVVTESDYSDYGYTPVVTGGQLSGSIRSGDTVLVEVTNNYVKPTSFPLPMTGEQQGLLMLFWALALVATGSRIVRISTRIRLERKA